MFADFIAGTLLLFGSPTSIAIFCAGMIGGLVFGAIPGLSLLTLAAILLPFTAWMSSTNAIMLFGVIYCAGVYGGAITAILFNIPGAPENAPTAFDGYPMARKGQAAKAIGFAITCSAIGGTLSAILMMVATEPIARFALAAFGDVEVFALVFFGLSVVTSIGEKSLAKGWIAMLLGLLLGTVGTDPVYGSGRFHFDSMYLLGGIGFIPFLLGFFAITEVIVQVLGSGTWTQVKTKVTSQFPSVREFWEMKVPIARSTVIGFIAGLLPGIGATLAAFMSYNEAVRWSRNRRRFGTGEPEGVVASETANNAATGAAMIPLLALGLPGGALTALMIGVFNIHDMNPGPLILTHAHDLVWALFASMFWASVGILLLGVLETKLIVHLTRVPFWALAPTIVVFATIGSFTLRNSLLDVWVMIVAGIGGYFLRKGGYSIPAIVMGLVLGQIGEGAFSKSMVILDNDLTGFFRSPIAAVLILAGFGSIVWPIFDRYRERRRRAAAKMPSAASSAGDP